MPVPFKLPRFYPILDTATLEARNCPVTSVADALFDVGIRVLQYRHKDDWTQRHFDEAKKLAQKCQDLGVLFVLNDRADYARLLRCALHIGQDDLPPLAARSVISDEILGLSTHNGRQLKFGDEAPVEYLSLGPVFSTQSKFRPDPVVGIDAFCKLRELTAKPLVAIGGITLTNAREVLDAKADSLAIISGILPADTNPKAVRRRAEEWLTALA
ncbi:MAG TPA: thiamine phosphate synthase [Bryobacteraceae bacterium]|jgi:thiamine-phosphate pyrophosphorylase|nr:thiamine phosphate synthase [Bryobacteraceae bacterium]